MKHKQMKDKNKTVAVSAYPVFKEDGNLKQVIEHNMETSDHKRSQDITSVLYSISKAVHSTTNLDELFHSIHESLSNIIDTTNFFIALCDKEKNLISFPYFVDVRDNYTTMRLNDSGSLTAEIINSGKSILINRKQYQQRLNRGELKQIPEIWLGVPLKIKNDVIGVMAVQSYTNSDIYSEKDIPLMESVAEQIAIAIERKRAEETLQKSEQELKIKNKISNIFLTVSDDEMYGEVLQVILENLQSKHGFFGYINQDGALVCPSMVKDIWEQCQIPDKDIVFPRKTWSGIWRRAMLEKKPLYSNKPFNMPPGHIPVLRALDVPIIYQEEVIGNILVGNKATDYDEKDQELLQTIVDHIAPVLYARLQKDEQERQRKLAEESLKESEIRYRTLFEAAGNAIFLARLDGKNLRFMDCNKRALQMFGCQREDIIGKTPLDFSPQTQPDGSSSRQLALKKIEKFLSGVEQNSFEWKHCHFDGTTFDAEVSLNLIDLGKNRYVLGTVRDITERKKAEKALKESEKNYRNLVDNALIGVFRTNLKGEALYANEASIRMFEFDSPEELMSDGVLTRYKNPKDREVFIENLMKTGKIDNFELELITKTGKKKKVLVNAVLDGDVLSGMVMDITERKLAEQGLVKANDRLLMLQQITATVHGSLNPQEVFRQITDTIINSMGFTTAIILTLDDSRQRYQVRSFASSSQLLSGINKILGFSLHDLTIPVDQMFKKAGEMASSGKLIVRKHLTEIAHPPLHKTTCRALEKLGKSKSFIIVPLMEGKKLIGGIVITSTQEQVSQDDLNMLQFFANVASQAINNADLYHKSRQAEQALRNSKEFIETIYNSVNDSISVIDTTNFRIVRVNSAFLNTLNMQEQDVIGKPCYEVTHHRAKPCEPPNDFCPLAETLKTGSYSSAEHIHYDKNDRKIHVEVSTSPIRNEKGEIHEVVHVARDISERKRAEEEKEKLEGQLRQSQKMEAIGTLAGGVAHDFNNLLTAILGNSELLLDGLNPHDPRREDLEEVKKAAERAATLTQQLLAFSRKQPLQKKVLNINALVANIEKMLNRLIGEDIKLVVDLAPNLRRIFADSGQMEQVIMNMVVNARDAMSDGGKLTIRTENVTIEQDYCKDIPYARPGKFTCLTIQDTGVGIDKTNITQIFDPFFTTKGPGGGTGLGLSVVYGIVKQHDGWINVYSELGQGSTFKIYLPAITIKSKEKTKQIVSLHEYQGNNERILLIEDETEVLNLAAKALAKNGYLVFKAETAKEALDIFTKEKGEFHLVFCDVVLPDQSGLQLVDQLLSRQPQLQVMLCSGYADQKSQWDLIQKKGFRFLRKPYTVTDLLKATKQVIKLNYLSSFN